MVKAGIAGILNIVFLSVNVSHAGFWQVENIAARSSARIDGAQYFTSDDDALRQFLSQVPKQHSGQSLQIDLPMPDGSTGIFEIFESSIMADALAAKYPQIKSYKVRGIDDPGASGRVDISPAGFRGMVFTSQGRILIDPVSGGSQHYMSRSVEDIETGASFSCSTGNLNLSTSVPTSNKISYRIEGGLLEFDLALSTTQEYVRAIGIDPTDADAQANTLAEMNTTISRVNAIYERDFGITLVLVADTDKLIELTDTDAFTNSNVNTMLSENQTWIDDIVGNNNYDIGHVFGDGGGGVAYLRVVCEDSHKAWGVSGFNGSANDGFYIDLVAHEIGHQFGANHTFNGTGRSCGGDNRSASTAFEPGSGSTIMAYAGICSTENIQSISDATFHAGSIAQVNSFVSGLSCYDPKPYSNNDPTANAGLNYNIPAGTAFVLQGSGSDVDGDTLSYQWDQMDAGSATDEDTLGDDLGDNALFRSYEPQNDADRHFPALGTQLDDLTDLSEALPLCARELNFRLTVRDGTSGQATDDVVLSVDDNSGPFQITSHNSGETIYVSSGSATLQWNVADTDNTTVNCQSVDIDLLTFSSDYATYAVNSLVTGTANDGVALVSLPDQSSTRARFRVSCSNNIFYDISDNDLTIQDSGTVTNFDTTGNDTFFNTEGEVFASRTSTCVVNKIAGGGGGAINIPWLMSVFSLFLFAIGRRKLASS
ncbi:MAG: hypothetical protein GY820_43150 [Gammaproteobacteria bacterium]|nr:hypothetical protein [Gammaproteobacteria bacterium]